MVNLLFHFTIYFSFFLDLKCTLSDILFLSKGGFTMELDIGEVSKITKLKPHTLRYYESIGLIQDIKRNLERGYKKMLEIDGEAGKNVENSLNDISPELAKYMIEYSFGDIYSREILELKAKEICVVAALTAMGNASPQLKVHINGALNVGCTISDIKEVMMQMSAYSGFPTSINAMNALKEVLKEREERGVKDAEGSETTNEVLPDERYEIGAKQLNMFDSDQLKKLEKSYGDFAPDLVKFIVNTQADFYTRDNFDVKYREMSTVAALTAMGTAGPQLKYHIKAALNVGVLVEEVKEIIILMTVYAGFPSAINAMNILKEVMKERN